MKKVSDLRRLSNIVLKDIGKTLTGDLLNIGSGSGKDGQGEYYENYFPFISSYKTMEYGKSKWTCKKNINIDSDVRNMTNVPDNSFDNVVIIWVLEHIDDVKSSVKEINRILRPNGKFIFGLPLNLHYHGKADYWRYTEKSVLNMLKYGNFLLQENHAIGSFKEIEIDQRLKCFMSDNCVYGPLGYVGVGVKV